MKLAKLLTGVVLVTAATMGVSPSAEAKAKPSCVTTVTKAMAPVVRVIFDKQQGSHDATNATAKASKALGTRLYFDAYGKVNWYGGSVQAALASLPAAAKAACAKEHRK